MDADCLIKLTGAGAKEAVLSAMEVSVPLAVKKEAVDEGKEGNYPDAYVIEVNINRGRLKAMKTQKDLLRKRDAVRGMVLHGGEKEVLSLFLGGSYQAIASDDARFLKKLEVLSIPYLTAAACVIYLYTSKQSSKQKVLTLLERLKGHISDEEYSVFRLFMEGMP
jgi:hypothetical protein